MTTPIDPLRLIMLISGGGTTLVNLMRAIEAGQVNATVDAVISSRPDVAGLERAAEFGIATHCVNRKVYDSSTEFGDAVWQIIKPIDPQLVCLGGFLSLLPIDPEYRCRVMNIHPGLLPAFGGKGMYGGRVHKAVLEHGCKIAGCTVHFADDQYDHGPIILQRACEVAEDDTPESLAKRVFDLECEAYPAAIELFRQGKLQVDGHRVRVVG